MKNDNTQSLIPYLDKKFTLIDERFEQIDKKFNKIDERFDQIDVKFNKIDKRFDQIDKKFNKVDIDIASIKVKISENKTAIFETNRTLSEKIDTVEKKLDTKIHEEIQRSEKSLRQEFIKSKKWPTGAAITLFVLSVATSTIVSAIMIYT